MPHIDRKFTQLTRVYLDNLSKDDIIAKVQPFLEANKDAVVKMRHGVAVFDMPAPIAPHLRSVIDSWGVRCTSVKHFKKDKFTQKRAEQGGWVYIRKQADNTHWIAKLIEGDLYTLKRFGDDAEAEHAPWQTLNVNIDEDGFLWRMATRKECQKAGVQFIEYTLD